MAVIWPLASDTWGHEEIGAATKVVASGRRTMGEEVRAFECEFARETGSRYAVAVNSGSSANLLMLAALRFHSRYPLEPGDEVIVPALAWATTYAPLYQLGLRVRVVDIDPRTLNTTPDRVLEALTTRTRAVLVVHVLGNPFPVAALQRLLPDHVCVLEDACEAMGARQPGGMTAVGARGLAGTFSTFFSHHITTGEGGLVVTDDEELYHLMLCLRAHGWGRDLPDQNTLYTPAGDRFHDDFRFLLPGFNLRPTELQGAVGRAQLRRLGEFVSARCRNAVRVRAYASDADWLETQEASVGSSWMAFALMLSDDAPISRDEFRKALAGVGIESRQVVGGNIARQPMAKYLGITGEFPNADRVHDRGVMIGNFSHDLSGEQVSAFSGLLRSICRERHRFA